jgi:hypothetical protein
LSSDNDGEALAAVHALRRALAQEGADIHELAKRIEGLSEADMKKLYDAGFEKGRSTAAATTTASFSSVDGPSFYEMACACKHKGGGRLSPKESDFINDMVVWCSRREPTEKQGKWLLALYCRIGRRS